MHAAIRDQADQVESPGILHYGLPGRQLLKRSPVHCIGDAHEVLLEHAARAQCQVADFRVAKLAVGQADRPARGL